MFPLYFLKWREEKWINTFLYTLWHQPNWFPVSSSSFLPLPAALHSGETRRWRSRTWSEHMWCTHQHGSFFLTVCRGDRVPVADQDTWGNILLFICCATVLPQNLFPSWFGSSWLDSFGTHTKKEDLLYCLFPHALKISPCLINCKSNKNSA